MSEITREIRIQAADEKKFIVLKILELLDGILIVTIADGRKGIYRIRYTGDFEAEVMETLSFLAEEKLLVFEKSVQ